jgi:hypothetical protein
MWFVRRRHSNLQAKLDDLERRAGARHDDANQRADRDLAQAGLLRLLVEATVRLEGLTWALVVLTCVLVVLTGVLAYDVVRSLFNH